jgi:hypothetical protein
VLPPDSERPFDPHSGIGQVEDTLFHVQTFFFVRDSPFFRDLLSRLRSASTPDPIVYLERDVKRVDFERLLSVLYPPYVGAVPCFRPDATALTETSPEGTSGRTPSPPSRAEPPSSTCP